MVYYCITSSPGEGGIGVVELFGRDSVKIIAKIFRPVLESFQPERFYLGYIYTNNKLGQIPQTIDQVIIHYTPARHSFIGLDTIEINAHGGMVPIKQISETLRALGARKITMDKLIGLARLDSIQKQALWKLLRMQTLLTTKVLLAQYQGALSRKLSAIKTMSAKRRRQALEKLCRTSNLGLALTSPKLIVIAGRPNVGKSTLFNALIGKDRALTHSEPGTTRDSIDETIAIKGVPFILVDTAGLRRSSGDPIEKLGMGITRKEMARADLIMLVVDASTGSTRENIIPFKNLITDKVIVVFNKIDLCNDIKTHHTRRAMYGITVSALQGTGLDCLKDQILKFFHISEVDIKYIFGQPVIFNRRQLKLLKI